MFPAGDIIILCSIHANGKQQIKFWGRNDTSPTNDVISGLSLAFIGIYFTEKIRQTTIESILTINL